MNGTLLEWGMALVSFAIIARFLWNYRYGSCKICEEPYVREMQPGSRHFKCFCPRCGQPKK
jgi:hypothetical protein